MESASRKCLLLFICVYVASSTCEGIQDPKPPHLMDDLITSLHHEEWEPDQMECLRATTDLLTGVKNHTLWATWVWNSIQLPVGTFAGSSYHLGSFDQCLQGPGRDMQYCLVDVTLAGQDEFDRVMDPYDRTDKFIRKKSRYGRKFNQLSFGVCMPSACHASSVATISQHLYKMSYLPFERLHVNPLDCQTNGQTFEKSYMFYLYWSFLLCLTMAVICVYSIGNTETISTTSKILHCFSPTRNYNALFERSAKEIQSLHGMRAITSLILIVMHYFIFANEAIFNLMACEKSIYEGVGAYLVHLDSFVDTFFVMSGLLHMNGLIMSKSSNPIRVLCKRYLRFIVTLSLIVATFSYIYPHTGSGPLWPRMARKHHEPCLRNWWRNLLMMGHKDDQGEYCIVVSWYINCDFQLTIFDTLLFLLYKTKPKISYIFYALATILSIVIPVGITYANDLPALLFYDFGESTFVQQNRVYDMVYIKSYARASSYLIGIALGYIMTIYKPQEYRKTISKRMSILSFTFAASLMLAVLRIGANLFNNQYGDLESALYGSLDRGLWALGVCIIIIVCEYGTLPLVSDLLSSRVFVPISKLSYLNYLLHSVFMLRNLYSMRVPVNYDFYQMCVSGLGYVALSCGTSYLLWFILEAPSANFINLLFDTKRNTSNSLNKCTRTKAVEENGVKIEKTL